MDPKSPARLDDTLAPAREATVEMLANRRSTFSLPQPFYNDARLFALDMQEIFGKEWLFAGMTCEIPAKGNYITLEIGDNPVILVRGNDGAVHGFHNVCRHRGSRLCVSDKGKVAKLVCPYHQWTYELDGRLLFAGTDMSENFDLSAYGLKPIQVRTAGGFIFISLAEQPPALDERRRGPRAPAGFPIRIVEYRGTAWDGTCLELGTGGMKVHTGAPLTRGAAVKLVFTPPDGGGPIEAIALVARLDRDGGVALGAAEQPVQRRGDRVLGGRPPAHHLRLGPGDRDVK